VTEDQQGSVLADIKEHVCTSGSVFMTIKKAPNACTVLPSEFSSQQSRCICFTLKWTILILLNSACQYQVVTWNEWISSCRY